MSSLRGFRLPSDASSTWYGDAADRWVRWRERAHQRRSEGIPSPEAVDEATAYYSGLYVERDPDPVAFRRLLRRRGVPDWSNPYGISDEQYHQMHREGFLWADVQFLVEELLSRASLPEDVPEEDKTRLHHAQLCWLMVLQETGGKWPRSLADVHPDNLVAITLDCLLNPHLALWGLDPGLWKSADLVN